MTMINLCFDSTVYKQTPHLSSDLFNILRKQCRIGRFRLYLPEVVELEYLTWLDQRIKDTHAALGKAIRSLDTLLARKKALPFDLFSHMAGIELDQRRTLVTTNWEQFKKDVSIIELPIAPHHGSQVMKAYFDGAKPFSARKNRDDIPDAFILAALLDLIRDNGKSYFLTTDTRFADALNGLNDLVVLRDLGALFERKEIAESTGMIVTSDAIQTLKNMLLYFRDELAPSFAQALQERFDSSEFTTSEMRQDFMENPDALPAEVHDLSLSIDTAAAITDTLFIVPFSARLEAQLAYGIDANELARFPKDRLERITSRDEPCIGYYDVVEIFPFSAEGQFSVALSDLCRTTPSPNPDAVTINVETMHLTPL